MPPKIGVLFKGRPNGSIRRAILQEFTVPDWMLLQVQERGSYRSEDMVTFLDWLLPEALTSEDSIVVILDWFTGHLTDEVYEVVTFKGHLLIFHGGGTTPFTQINDTHLHALVQRLMEQLENEVAHSQHKAAADAGQRKTPKLRCGSI